MNATKESLKKFLWIFLCFLSFNLTYGKVTPFIHSHSRRSIFNALEKPIPGPEKEYTGLRVRNDTQLLLYYHEQTIAVVEVLGNEMHNCELLEVRTEADNRAALTSLKPVVPWQQKIKFMDMIELMNECQKLGSPMGASEFTKNAASQKRQMRNMRQLSSLLNGVLPGTKWCGLGDIAKTYFDLGPEREVDKCCRTHDLCPVKVAGLNTQYELVNYSIYTRSHCVCDELFYECLKNVNNFISSILGGIYFNVTPLTCVEDVLNDDKTTKRLVTKHKRF